MGNLCGGGGGTDGTGGRADPDANLKKACAVAKRELDSCHLEEFEKKFIMKKVLGRGEYSKVVECVRIGTSHKYAVKILEKGQCDRSVVIKEIALTRMLFDHPNTIKLHEVFEDKFSYYLVLELCNGGELFERVLSKGHFSEKEAAEKMMLMLNFLAFAHSRDIIHRDLKPHNILMLDESEDSPIRIIDFGTSDVCREGQRLTESIGTPHYIAPEVLDEDYDKSADIWSLGVVMYILLAGSMPFGGANEEATIKMVTAGKYSLESKVWTTVSSEAKDMLASMLQKDVSKRATIAQLQKHPWFAVAAASSAAITAASDALPRDAAPLDAVPLTEE